MLSMPPTRTTSCSPARIIRSPYAAARMPDAQTLLIVSEPTPIGQPTPAETWRDGIMPTPA